MFLLLAILSSAHSVRICVVSNLYGSRLNTIIKGLDPRQHIELGRAIKEVLSDNILVIGSGFSFHNMSAFNLHGENNVDERNGAFQDTLIQYCTEDTFMETAEHRLIEWETIPHARYCHPREEHLLPLHVCLGMAQAPGKVVFDDYILGKRSIALLWE